MLTLNLVADASGLLSARPSASSVVAGYVYFATDIDKYSVSNTVTWIDPATYNAMTLLADSGLLAATPVPISLTIKEGVAPTNPAGYDSIYADSTAHRLKMKNNNNTADTVVGANTTDTLTNKQIGDPTTPTKAIAFTLSGATAAKTLTLVSAHTNDRSITFPDATDTLVGKATTDTLTNKTISLASNTIGDAVGNITRYRRTLFWEYNNTSNLADTNYFSNTPYSLPAGTLSVNGDALEIEVIYTFDATAATKTYAGNIGYTSWAADGTGFTGGQSIYSAATTTTSATVIVKAIIQRLTSTVGSVHALLSVNTAFQNTAFTTFSQTWANATNILFEAKSSVGTAGIATIRTVAIRFIPYT